MAQRADQPAIYEDVVEQNAKEFNEIEQASIFQKGRHKGP